MIEKYEIKNNTLYLYLTYDYEFASLNINNINNDIKNVIKNINKIYKTNKVKIIVGGLLVLTIPLTVYYKNINSNTTDISYDNNVITETLDTNNTNEYTNNYSIINDNNIFNNNEENTNEIIENNVITSSDNVNNNDNYKENNTNNTIDTSYNEVNTTTNNNNANSNNILNNDNSINTENNVEEIVDNNIYVTINRSNGDIVKIELEEYIIGVVAAEMPASFNIEALKAQAVIARTYALKRLNEGKIITDNSSTQNYKDNNQLQSYWQDNYSKYYNKVKSAVESTKGEYITYNNYYIDAVYHASNNGYTIDASNIWNYEIPYLKSVDSSWDKNTTSYEREMILDINLINNILGININTDSVIDINRDNTNHINTISIDNNTYTGKVFREKLGLRSTDFEIEIQDNNLVITTYGYGHAVGLSQYGSNEMAKLGYDYQDIIHHYYNSVSIVK